jgi:hypothetical protein
MQAKPLFLCACAFASIAGAVGGTTTNTTPIQKARIGSEMLPQASIEFDRADSGLPEVALPDHYAMTTPEGRVEVAALATRGLYAQQRFGWDEASYDIPEAPAPEPVSQVEPLESHGEPAYREEDPARPEPSGDRQEITPRIIDVAAELATAASG